MPVSNFISAATRMMAMSSDLTNYSQNFNFAINILSKHMQSRVPTHLQFPSQPNEAHFTTYGDTA